MKWCFLTAAVLLTAAANIFLKFAATSKKTEYQEALQFLKGSALNPWQVSGLGCLAAAMVFYTLSLRSLPLSIAYPVMTCSVVVLVAFLSQFFFHEYVTLNKLIGTSLVIAGVIILSR